jgi:hypothetical protein
MTILSSREMYGIAPKVRNLPLTRQERFDADTGFL